MNKLFLGLFAITMVACSNDDETAFSSNEMSEPISTVIVDNGVVANAKACATVLGSEGNALRFENENALMAFKAKLENMSDDAKMRMMAKYNVSNLHELAKQADEELEILGNSATSEDEFRQMYAAYVQKYRGKLVQNTSDETDLTLYVPNEDDVETYIANENGEYVVGDEVKTVSLNESQTPASAASVASVMAASADNTNVNIANFKPEKNKKIHVEAYMRGARMWVKMSAKKKMWYGWKNDSHRYYMVEFHISNNVTFLYSNKNGAEIEGECMPRYYYKQDVENGFNKIFCKINSGSTITGYINTWTDLTSEHDSNGNQIMETIRNISVPKCLAKKAGVVKIQLKLQ